MWLLCRRRIDAAPQVRSSEFVATAGLQIAEQLRAIGRRAAEDERHDELADGVLSPEHLDVPAEHVVGLVGQQRPVFVGVRGQ